MSLPFELYFIDLVSRYLDEKLAGKSEGVLLGVRIIVFSLGLGINLMAIEVTRCLHSALLVSDVACAAAFYDQVLQLPKVERPFNYSGIWYQLGATQFHLIEDPTFSAQLHNLQKLGANPHVAFGVTDLNLVRSQLDAQNYPYEMSSSGRLALFLQDPDGNVIEISQDAGA